ncbi:MAG TPA: DUF3306 domain-containing protein [Alphaproteobacteria bacterium]|nr:DUF3306 domain-containing protein [Alphaproteobacteria bacterium]
MSIGDDTFFVRWSRSKQAAREAKTAKPDEETAASPAAEADAVPADRELPAPEATPADAPEPLPSVEDLTAESDLTAFLREGVPEFLRTAALRKMWSLDPKIRDHIGLSECAWDFNQPGSIPGFGPIGATGSVTDFLSRPAVAEVASPELPISSVRSPVPTARSTGGMEAVSPPEGLPPAQEVVASDPKADTRAEVDKSPDEERTIARRHGGALPRE